MNGSKSIIIVLILLCTFSLPCQAHAHKPPLLTVAVIIEIFEQEVFKGIVLIKQKNTSWGKALPGGKVEYGETVEEAAYREMRDELHLELHDLKQFHVYSHPNRDTIEVTQLAKAYHPPTAGDGIAKVSVIKIEEIPWSDLASDHAKILMDYLAYHLGQAELAMPVP